MCIKNNHRITAYRRIILFCMIGVRVLLVCSGVPAALVDTIFDVGKAR